MEVNGPSGMTNRDGSGPELSERWPFGVRIARAGGHGQILVPEEQVYGHLMPEALQTGADATEHSVMACLR